MYSKRTVLNTFFNLRLNKELVDMKSLQKYTDKTQKWSGGRKPIGSGFLKNHSLS